MRWGILGREVHGPRGACAAHAAASEPPAISSYDSDSGRHNARWLICPGRGGSRHGARDRARCSCRVPGTRRRTGGCRGRRGRRPAPPRSRTADPVDGTVPKNGTSQTCSTDFTALTVAGLRPRCTRSVMYRAPSSAMDSRSRAGGSTPRSPRRATPPRPAAWSMVSGARLALRADRGGVFRSCIRYLTGTPTCPWRRRNPRHGGGFRGGRYWARTSDLRLVEAALSQLS
jgi:hypothetical protein